MKDCLDGSKEATKFLIALFRTLDSQNPGFLVDFEQHLQRVYKDPDQVDLKLIETFHPLTCFFLGKMSSSEAEDYLENPFGSQ